MYTVYKTINLINDKFYIGVHKTDNPYDSYLGSGVAIRQAINKYGRENFMKEILFTTECEAEAYSKEAELTACFEEATNYNMRRGGVGGFTKENARRGLVAKSVKGGNRAKELKTGVHSLTKEQLRENGRKGGLANKGKPKSEEFKQKIRDTWARKRMERTSSTAVSASPS